MVHFLDAFRLCLSAPILALLAVSADQAFAVDATMRTYRDQQGREIEARMKALEGDQVTLLRADGQRFTAALSLFSEADQERIREQFAGIPDEPFAVDARISALNALFGKPLFGDTDLWNSSPEKIQEALILRKESMTAYEASYRRYPNSSVRLLGARPYSIVLYTSKGRPTSLSIVFMNRGDLLLALRESEVETPLTESSALAHLNTWIQRDTEVIGNSLDSVLGEGRFFATGQGTFREATRRWDWRGHSFLLTSGGNGFVGLTILPTEVADARGRAQWTSGHVLRERMRRDLLKNDFGDVLVQNLPMVDQGPRGYCVPATFERVLRYYEIPADLYRLAQAGGSGIGGGTYLSSMLDGVENLVRRSGRNIATVPLGPNLQAVARQIDEGMPILWLMYSGADYNRMADAHTRARAEATNVDSWRNALGDPRARARSLPVDQRAAHICLIVGYNRLTGEVAVSDSWDPGYALRWITYEEMRRVSSRDTGYIIRF